MSGKTYTRFLSKHPIQDIYGIIETPGNSGLTPSVDTATIPTLTNKPTGRQSNKSNSQDPQSMNMVHACAANSAKAPLKPFTFGVTVFAPLFIHNVPSTARVGITGIGGLGHMALQFVNNWGCEAHAFTTSDSKEAEAHKLGAHYVHNTKEDGALKKIA